MSQHKKLHLVRGEFLLRNYWSLHRILYYFIPFHRDMFALQPPLFTSTIIIGTRWLGSKYWKIRVFLINKYFMQKDPLKKSWKKFLICNKKHTFVFISSKKTWKNSTKIHTEMDQTNRLSLPITTVNSIFFVENITSWLSYGFSCSL